MTPFFFGSSKKQLFGAHDPPIGGKGRHGAVICYPWGREYLLAHRALRFLARKLSTQGYHVLRFDYYGTGDSAGGGIEVTQDHCLADIETAIDELKEIGGLSEVGLVGLRYGATLAAFAAGTRRDISRLVLWEPVFDGHAYLKELGLDEIAAGMSTEADGFEVSGTLRLQWSGINLHRFDNRLPRTLLTTTMETPESFLPLENQLRSQGVDCRLLHSPDVPVWEETGSYDYGSTGLPVRTLAQIVDFMS